MGENCIKLKKLDKVGKYLKKSDKLCYFEGKNEDGQNQVKSTSSCRLDSKKRLNAGSFGKL